MLNVMQTKLFRPSPTATDVVRPRLNQQLNAGLRSGKRLTLVSAPAGFGKTSCISAWLATVDWSTAWLSLEPADDDPVRFFTYLIAALQQVDENLGWDLAGVLHAGQLPEIELLSTRLVNDILQVEQPFILVIDDFQIVQQQAVLEVFSSLLSYALPGLHLVLITREDPPLPLARLRAHNQLVEVRAADLRFTRDEIAEYCARHLPVVIPARQLLQLDDLSEGWIVGLQLVALSIRKRDGHSLNELLADLKGGNRHILDYLADEVIGQQPQHIRQFLLYTSVLERLHPDLCNTLTERNDSVVLLHQLRDANLFLFSLDDQEQWYRYHALFANALQSLLHTHQPTAVSMLHRRASQWYADQGNIDTAMYHAVAAKDDDLIMGLLEGHAMHLLLGGNIRTVQRWLAAIPEDWRIRSQRVMLVIAWVHVFKREVAQASHVWTRLSMLEPDNPTADLERQTLEATILNAKGKPTQSLALTRMILRELPAEDSTLRMLVLMTQGDALQQLQDYNEATSAYESMVAHSRVLANLATELLGSSVLALMALNRGQLQYAYDIAMEAANRVEHSGLLPPICMGIYGELGQIHYAWNQITPALDFFQRAIQVSELSGYSDAVLYEAIIRSRLALRNGDQVTATAALERALSTMRKAAPTVAREQVRAQEVRVLLAGGNIAKAEQVLMREGFGFNDHIATPDLKGISSWALANSWLRCVVASAVAAGTLKPLERLLAVSEDILDAALVHKYLPAYIETLLVQAKIYSALGQHENTYSAIEHAIALAKPEGFISLFIDEGTAIASALREMAIADRFKNRTNVATMAALCNRNANLEDRTLLVEKLSKREQEVLRLMADGFKYQEIAEALIVSLNTVRFHVKSIYGKLGVNNRTRAITFARRHNMF